MTFYPRRCLIFSVRVPKRGWGLIIPSPTYSLRVQGPPTEVGGTDPSSPSEPSRGKAETVGATSSSFKTVRIRFLRRLHQVDRTKKKERKIRMLVWPNGAKSSESSALAARTFNFSDLLFFVYPQAHHLYFTTESSKHKKSGKQQNDVETTSRPKKESSSTLEIFNRDFSGSS